MGTSNDKVRTIAEAAISKLVDELDGGKSEVLTNYLAVAARFRRYSWNNLLLIAAQRPSATRVAGIHAWNDLERHVRKGEKGIAILAPLLRRQEPAMGSGPVQESQPNDPLRLAGFRTVYVFDLAQTEGKALPEFAQTTGDPKDLLDRLKAIATHRGIAIDYDHSIAPALGVSHGGRIQIVPDLAKAEEFAVLAHEMAHEALHHTPGLARLPKVVRETQAEAVAFVVSHAAGLETNHAAADYIALYNGDKRTLMESLQTIQKTASELIDELFPEPQRDPSPTDVPVLLKGTATTPRPELPSLDR